MSITKYEGLDGATSPRFFLPARQPVGGGDFCFLALWRLRLFQRAPSHGAACIVCTARVPYPPAVPGSSPIWLYGGRFRQAAEINAGPRVRPVHVLRRVP